MNNNDAAGTPSAHYSPPSDGPFDCSNCIHFHRFGGKKKASHHTTKHGGTCDHPEVQKDAEAGHIAKTADGKPLVQAGGCCEYQR